ncbi:MAG: hypothetical protein NC193_09920 [bacterium]|nr:hypothetical protein [bacterium]
MNNRTAAVLTALMLLCIGVAAYMSLKDPATDSQQPYGISRRTVYDTVTVYRPVPRDSVVTRYVTVRLPVTHPPDTAAGTCASTDSADVDVPLSSVEFRDSTYRIWASGFRVSIDSLRIYPRTEYVTLTPPAPRRHRWHIGPTVGYGLTPHGPEPFIGISVTYSLFSW